MAVRRARRGDRTRLTSLQGLIHFSDCSRHAIAILLPTPA
jgi:hypothetical protein